MSPQPPQIPKDELPPLAAALVDKPVWVRQLVLLPLITVLLGLLFGFPGYFVWKALSYVPARATVETCDPPSKDSDCHGSWVTEDGERGSGVIDGVSRSDEGTTIDVWAAGGSATTSPPWSWWIVPGIFGVAFVMAGVVIVKAIRDSRKDPKARAQVPKDWEPPAAFPPRHVPELYAAPEVQVSWEPRGIGGEISYEFSAAGAGVLARAGEPDLDLARRIWRFLDQAPGDQRHRLVCLDPYGDPLFTVDKPKNRLAPLTTSTATVLGPTGHKVGSITQISRNPFRRRFDCHDASGRLLARVAHPTWTSESYRVTDRHGTEVARLVHGVDQRPLRTDGMYRYVLQLRHQPPEPMHTMLLSAVVCVKLLVGDH